jgi:excisionase family DNA binding protein
MARRMREVRDESVGRYMDVSTAAAYLGVTRTAVYHLIARHAIPFARLGRRILIDRIKIDDYLQRRAVNTNEGEPTVHRE